MSAPGKLAAERRARGLGPLLLVTTAHPSLMTHRDPRDADALHPNLGRLIQPRHTSSIELTAEAGVPWAADNDCFNGLDEVAYFDMLDRLKGLPGCVFVTVPDVVRCTACYCTVDGYGGGSACRCIEDPEFVRYVVGDAALTARRFEEWAPGLERRGLPVGLVMQDGFSAPELRGWLERSWHRIDALFVGGSTEFKLSDEAAGWAKIGAAHGKWIHWGRVNSAKRIEYVTGTGACDSFDGSGYARWRNTLLDGGLEDARRAGWEYTYGERQLALETVG
jgi:hypothetical protein